MRHESFWINNSISPLGAFLSKILLYRRCSRVSFTGPSWKVLFAVFDWKHRFSRLAAIAIKYEWRRGRFLRERGRCLFLARPFPMRNMRPECLARNKRRGSSIIHYHLPSIPYRGMLYDLGIAPRNLSDGISLRFERREREYCTADYNAFGELSFPDILSSDACEIPRILHIDYKIFREFARTRNI